MKTTVIITFILLAAFSATAKEQDADTRRSKTEQIKRQTEQIKDNNASNIQTPVPAPTRPPSQPLIPENITSLQQPAAMTGEQINWQVISAGGTLASSTNFILAGTVGQTATGLSGSSTYQLNSGFWQTFTGGSGGCCIGNTGDVDGNGSVDIGDLLFLVDYQFVPGSPAPPCLEEANVDGSGAVDVSDLLYLVDYQFTPGSPAPVPCP